MADFDYAREAALKLALQHHGATNDTAQDVVATAHTFLEFLTAQTESDKAFRAKIDQLAQAARPLD